VQSASQPPTVTAVTSNASTQGDYIEFVVYNFTATASDPTVGNTISSTSGYTWNFGDGTVLNHAGAQVSHAFSQTGLLTLTVTATDSQNVTSSSFIQAETVGSGPNPFSIAAVYPAASAPLSQLVQTGSSINVTFDFTVSLGGTSGFTYNAAGITFKTNDPLTDTVVTALAAKNGSPNEWIITMALPAAAATGPRSFTPTVQVLDTTGAIQSAIVPFGTITITTTPTSALPPLVTLADSPQIPVAGDASATWQNVPVNFSATATDPGGFADLYSWSFGDTGGLGDLASTDLLSTSHAYAAPGIYTVTFTATNGIAGGTRSTSLVIDVLQNGPPTALTYVQNPTGNPFAYEPITFSAVAVDPNGDPMTITWSWGDGSPDSTGTTVTHTWTAVGNANASVTADDGKGGVTSKAIPLVIQANLPPVATVTTPVAALFQDKPYTFAASATDKDAGDTIAQFLWTFGDGGTATTLPAASPAGQTRTTTVSHTFAASFTGPAVIQVQAIDSRGGVGDPSPSVSFPITVTSLPVSTFLIPAGAQTFNTELGAPGVLATYVVSVTNPNGGGAFLPVGAITFSPNDALATLVSSASNGDGTYTFQVRYAPTASVSTRTSTPSVIATDLVGITGSPALGPVITITTQLVNHPPQVTLSAVPAIPAGPNATWKNDAVVFNASAVDPDGDPLSVSWNFGDGTVVAPVLASAGSLVQTHTFTSASPAGGYPVQVTVNDGRTNGLVSAMVNISVLNNSLPTLSAHSSTLAPYAYVPVTFTATASSFNGEPVTVTWDFGDTTSGSGLSVIHAYQEAVPVVVTVKADDGEGGITTQTINLAVQANLPPVSKVTTSPASLPNPLLQNTPYVFTASATDPDTGDTISGFTWSFGDGSASVPSAAVGSGQTATTTVTHSFSSSFTGTASVRVLADDSHFAVGDFSPAVNFTVQATALPVVTFTTDPAVPQAFNTTKGGAGTVVDYFVSSTNPNGAPGTFIPIIAPNPSHLVPAPTFPSITFSPGDPGATVQLAQDNGDGTYLFKVLYLPAASASPTPRAATPQVVATDLNGTSSTATVLPITITTTAAADTPPAVTITATPAVSAGIDATWMNDQVTFTATATDADKDPMVYTWDFGDGSSTAVTNLTSTLTQTHTYLNSGVYPVQLTVDDGRTNGKVIADLTMNVLANSGPTISGPVTVTPAGNLYKYQPLTFSATVTDVTGYVPVVTFTFGDGTVLPAANTIANPTIYTANRAFTTAGQTTVKASATDAKGGAATSATLPLTIIDNNPPAATILTPAATLNQRVSYPFSATATDPNTGGAIRFFHWTFGDGTTATSNPVGSGQTSTTTWNHTYAPTFSGAAVVQVQAEDMLGSWGVPSPAVTFTVVPDVAPSAAAVGAVAGVTGNTATVAPGGTLSQNKLYSFAASATAGTFPVASYNYDYGDGTVDSLGSHIYGPAVAGPVSVRVQGVDSNGLAGAFSPAVTFNISSVLPVASFLVPATAQTYHVTASTGTVVVPYVVKVTNPNGASGVFLPIADLTFVDASGSPVGATDNHDGTYTFKYSYGPGAPSRLVTPTVTATDLQGIFTTLAAPPAITIQTVGANTAPVMTTVPYGTQFLSTPPDPTVTLQAPGINATWAGVPITFPGADISDPDGDPMTATWDFGDGTPVVTTYNNLASVPPVTHTYAANGYYTVKLTVDDGRPGGVKWLDVTPGVTVLVHDSVQSIAITGPAGTDYAWSPLAFNATVLDSASKPYSPALVRWDMGDLMPALASTNYAADSSIVSSLYLGLPSPWQSYSKSSPAGTLGFGQEVLLDTLGTSVTWAYPPRGLTQVVATAYDGMGGVATSNTLQFPVANAPGPVASVTTAAATLFVGYPATFTASAVSAVSLPIANYVWNFGDGTPVLVTLTGSTSHVYTSTGTVNVTVYAVDAAGTAGTLSAPVAFTVQIDLAPTNAAVAVRGHAGNTSVVAPGGTLSQNKLYDFTGSATAGTFPIASYIYDYGDGTVDSLGSHIYAPSVAGPVTVTVQPVDTKGIKGATSPAATFNIGNVLPVASFLVPATAQTYHVTAATGTVVVPYLVKVTNPNGTPGVFLPITDLTFTDGSGSPVSATDNQDGTYLYKYSYAPGAPSRPATPTVTATDLQGIFTTLAAPPAVTIQTVPGANTAPEMTTVASGSQYLSTPPDPTVSLLAPGTNATWAGVPITFPGADISDPDGDPMAATWDFGDGTPVVTTYNNLVSVPPVTHTYASNGYYTVKLTVDDGRANGVKWLDVTPGVTVLAHDSVQSIAITGPAGTDYAWSPLAFTATVLDSASQTYAPAFIRWDMGDLMPAATSTNYPVDSNIVSSLYQGLPAAWQAYSSAALGFGQEIVLNTQNPAVTWAYPPRGLTRVVATAYDGMGGVATSNTLQFPVANVPGPVATLTTPAGTLYKGATSVFAASAVSSAGLGIANYVWNFGDGTPVLVTLTGSASHVYTTTGTMNVTVYAVDAAGTAGTPTSPVAFTVQTPVAPVVTFSSMAPVAQSLQQGTTYTQVFHISVSNPQVLGGASITAASLRFLSNDPLAGLPTIVDTGANTFAITVLYNASLTPGPRTTTPTVFATDSLGIIGTTASGPSVTITSIGIAPSITITTPGTSTTQTYAYESPTVSFVLTDPIVNPVTYTVDWGDTTTSIPDVTSATVSDPSLPTGFAVTLTHQFTVPGTYAVTVNASDTRPSFQNAQQQTVNFTVLANALPTAQITLPLGSGTPGFTTGQIASYYYPSGMASPLPTIAVPTTNYPIEVIPEGGSLFFAGTVTLPTSGEALKSSSWNFPLAVPTSAGGTTPPTQVTFAGVPGQLTAYLVSYQAEDAFNRLSAPAYVWIVVDGVHTENFTLNLLYRQLGDNGSTVALNPVVSSGNGLNTQVEIHQDGYYNSYTINSAGQASVTVPVRSNVPFYTKVPAIGADTISYAVRIPSQPAGTPGADPSWIDPELEMKAYTLSARSSSFSFQSSSAPYNPTLNVVTAQGFAPEASNTVKKMLQGRVGPSMAPNSYTQGTSYPHDDRWLVLPSEPSITYPITWPDSVLGYFSGIPVNQTFAEWPLFMLAIEPDKLPNLEALAADTTYTTNPVPSDLGFNLNYAAFSNDPIVVSSSTPASRISSVERMEAYRVPSNSTDPYDLSKGVVNWDEDTFVADLNPTPVLGTSPATTSYYSQIIVNPASSGTPFSGGLDDLVIPYDLNDPNRLPLASPMTHYLQNMFPVFAYAEYLWSSVWVQPVVLNSANLNTTDTLGYGTNMGISQTNWLLQSNPAAWPKLNSSSPNPTPIEPDGSYFDLTANGAGVFDASSPVTFGTPATSGSAPTAPKTDPTGTSVGHFYWTAFTPSYSSAAGGALITRTWLAEGTGVQAPPVAADFNGSASTDAASGWGFVPAQDTMVDKRLRNPDGTLAGPATGGYRVTWFNATLSPSGTVVPPDFWVIELKSGGGAPVHFMVPSNYPAQPNYPAPANIATDTTQTLASPIVTDARWFIAPPAGPGLPDSYSATWSSAALAAPGYCWFDVPTELRPADPADLTVWAVKSILANQPPSGANPRPLNRPDWLDGIKTAVANMLVTPSDNVDKAYAHKIPFNFPWDIVVTNSEPTPVAPTTPAP